MVSRGYIDIYTNNLQKLINSLENPQVGENIRTYKREYIEKTEQAFEVLKEILDRYSEKSLEKEGFSVLYNKEETIPNTPGSKKLSREELESVIRRLGTSEEPLLTTNLELQLEGELGRKEPGAPKKRGKFTRKGVRKTRKTRKGNLR